MIIFPETQTKRENYKLMIGSILPRPIAFVTSKNHKGLVNAAPFSFFNIVGTEPPLVGMSVIRKPGGELKDTAKNILETKEFVVHVVDTDNVELVNQTAIDYPHNISEVDEVGLTKVESTKVNVPGIKESKIRMECKLHKWVPVGGTDDSPNADFIIGEVVCFHICDDIYEEGKIDPEKLNPVSRLAGTVYATVGKMFSRARLTYEELLSKGRGCGGDHQ